MKTNNDMGIMTDTDEDDEAIRTSAMLGGVLLFVMVLCAVTVPLALIIAQAAK